MPPWRFGTHCLRTAGCIREPLCVSCVLTLEPLLLVLRFLLLSFLVLFRI
jgi:hypothetical protein